MEPIEQVEAKKEHVDIEIVRSLVFKRETRRPGCIFYIAKFNKGGFGYQQGFHIVITEETKQGEPAIKAMVRDLILKEHFNG